MSATEKQKSKSRTPKGWTDILARVKILGDLMKDPDHGLKAECWRKPGTKVWTYSIARMGVPTAEDHAMVLKEAKERASDQRDVPSLVAADLAYWFKWEYEVESLWRIDSILQMIEAGDEPGGSIILRKGFPATH